jgi:hypothetical protein
MRWLVLALIGCAAAPPAKPLVVAAPVKGRSDKQIFREIYVGWLPANSKRTTWTLTTLGDATLLVSETATATPGFRELDDKVNDESRWAAGERAEIRVKLPCKEETIEVHAANAKLIRGHKNDDDTMTDPTWSPAGVTKVKALHCTGELALHPFSEGLYFADPPVEWAFNNSDMSIQAGGFRFIPR